MTKIRKVKIRFLLFIFCLMCICCVHIEQRHTGKIIDSDTQKPLKDVIVFLELYCHCLLPPNPGGNSASYIGYTETLTDDNGKYNLSPGFYLMPPLVCITDEPRIHFFKVGYFTASARNEYEKAENEQTLYKMNHYLNYLPYKLYTDSYIQWHYGGKFEEESKLLDKTNPHFMKHLHLHIKPADEMGVFFRSPGRKFTRIKSTFEIDYSDPLHTNRIVFAYDEPAKEWICMDSRGTLIDIKNKSSEDGRKIPELPETYRASLEIENDGNSICHNTSRSRVSRQLDPVLINPPLNCFTGKDLPATKEDDSLKDSKFIYSEQSRGNGYYVVTRTLKFWHIYNFLYGYDAERRTMKFKIRRLLSFPIEKDIVGLAASDNDFFLAFKNEGIRKYQVIIGQDFTAKENNNFFINSSRVGKLNINSISFGSTVNMRAIYATTGDDKIYRFSEADGTPDYIATPMTGQSNRNHN